MEKNLLYGWWLILRRHISHEAVYHDEPVTSFPTDIRCDDRSEKIRWVRGQYIRGPRRSIPHVNVNKPQTYLPLWGDKEPCKEPHRLFLEKNLVGFQTKGDVSISTIIHREGSFFFLNGNLHRERNARPSHPIVEHLAARAALPQHRRHKRPIAFVRFIASWRYLR